VVLDSTLRLYPGAEVLGVEDLKRATGVIIPQKIKRNILH
jgi:hypothetical protein